MHFFTNETLLTYKNYSVSKIFEELKTNRERFKDYSKIRNLEITIGKAFDLNIHIAVLNMLHWGLLTNIYGCFSSGKEAYIYLGSSKGHQFNIAIKIYWSSHFSYEDKKYDEKKKSYSENVFKTKSRQKKINLWAEKEFRNLIRLYNASLPVPKPIYLRNNLVIMQFIGKNGIPAPLLKDVILPKSKTCELYISIVVMIRRLFQDCKLVHADLSEYNILYHEASIYIIDVSQSVNIHHKCAKLFLKRDCKNINKFFNDQDVSTFKINEIFDFITNKKLTPSKLRAFVRNLIPSLRHNKPNILNEEEKSYSKNLIRSKLYNLKTIEIIKKKTTSKKVARDMHSTTFKLHIFFHHKDIIYTDEDDSVSESENISKEN